jgi:hypothetical protein
MGLLRKTLSILYATRFLAVNVDGRQIPAKPLQPDFENAGLFVSIDFDHVVKLCIQDDVDGPCQSFGEMNLHT